MILPPICVHNLDLTGSYKLKAISMNILIAFILWILFLGALADIEVLLGMMVFAAIYFLILA